MITDLKIWEFENLKMRVLGEVVEGLDQPDKKCIFQGDRGNIVLGCSDTSSFARGYNGRHDRLGIHCFQY